MAKKYLTPEGLKKIQDELGHLKNVRRRELSEQLERAIGFGDISENAEFQEAKEEQAFVEGRIMELEEILREAKVLDSPRRQENVGIGSVVFVTSGQFKEKFRIVGAEEANPMEGKISMDSPLGKAVLNQQKGAEIIVYAPEGKKKYKIVGIE